VSEKALHPVLRHELELLQLAHAPLLLWGEEATAVEVGELFFVAMMLFAELAEIVIFSGESFDERLRVGHADLLARVLPRNVPQPAMVLAIYTPALSAVKAWHGAADAARWP
jgi:hypothetical protein